MNSELEEIITKYYTDLNVKLINYKETSLLNSYLLLSDTIENFEVRDDDIWVCGYPKSGTRWSQEMVWNIANNLNFEASAVNLSSRFPFLEFSGMYKHLMSLSEEQKQSGTTFPPHLEDSIEYSKNFPSPRFLKTHLPFHLLPRQLRTNEKKAKIIYVSRNPKDVCISFYHFSKYLRSYSGNFTDFCKLFLNDKVHYGPFWNHVIQYWDKRNETNVSFLKFEDMKSNISSVIRKVANFLGKNLSDEQISKLENHLQFKSMTANSAVSKLKITKFIHPNPEGKFMRKGEANQWKEDMTNEIIEQFDEWTRKNLKNNESLLREFL